MAGPEFKDLQEHILVTYKALYGLKSSGLRWAQRIHDIMLQLGFHHVRLTQVFGSIYVDEIHSSKEEIQLQN